MITVDYYITGGGSAGGRYRAEGSRPTERLADDDTSWMAPVTYEIRPTREEKIAAKKAARKAAKPRRIKFK